MNKATIKVLIAMLLWGSLGVFVKNISRKAGRSKGAVRKTEKRAGKKEKTG